MFQIVAQLSQEEQQAVLEAIREPLSLSPLHTFVMPARGIARKSNCSGVCEDCFIGAPDDRTFHVASTSTGPWGWISNRCGYHYVETHPRTGQPFPPIPAILVQLAQEVAQEYGYHIEPQSGYINLYRKDGRLGLHQDNSEKTMIPPVISISLGADAIFQIGGRNRDNPVQEILLHSGDIMLMGGEHRLAYHGIKAIVPGTVPPDLQMKQDCRINITIRQYQ